MNHSRILIHKLTNIKNNFYQKKNITRYFLSFFEHNFENNNFEN
jgi:hypothetical protein